MMESCARKRGFTLVEMLVVVGIIATLMGVLLASVSKFVKTADKARCQELVSNTATALTALFQRNGAWPRVLISNHNSEMGLSATAAIPLAKGGYMSLGMNSDKDALGGRDRLGVLTPWGQAVVKSKGKDAELSTKVPSGGTIADHVLRYALDLDGDGVIPGVSIGGDTVDIRATAAVWCCGKDGVIEAYSEGVRKDDIYSWTVGQTREVRK